MEVSSRLAKLDLDTLRVIELVDHSVYWIIVIMLELERRCLANGILDLFVQNVTASSYARYS